MSVAKKIFLLVILLLLLMVTCVYTHIDEFTQTDESIPLSEEIIAIDVVKEVTITQWFSNITSSITEKLMPNDEEASKKVEDNDAIKVKEVIVEEVVVGEPTHELPKAELPEDPQEKAILKETEESAKPLVTPKTQKETTSLNVEPSVEKPKELIVESAQEVIPVEVTQVEVSSEAPLKSYGEIQDELDDITNNNRIIFKRLSTDVTQKSLKTVDEIASLLKKYKDIKVEIGGHTDAKGDDEVNAYVSKHRALSVRKLLIKAGIAEERLTAKGYGESQPIVKNDVQGYSMKNRRVEFKIIKD